MRACAGCGAPTLDQWCSETCRRAEDGLTDDEFEGALTDEDVY